MAVEGGVAEVLRGLTRHGRHAGYDAHVLFLRPGPAVARIGAVANWTHAIDVGRMRSLRRISRAWRSVDAVLRAVSPDVVVGMEPSAQVYVALPARRRRIPVVWQQHACVDARSAVERVAHALPAARAVANSAFVARGLRDRPRRPISVVKPGIDVRRFADADGSGPRRELGLGDDTPLVGIIGRLQPWKGQHLFLTAAAHLSAQYPRARFVVVGGAEMGWETGDYPGRLRRLARELGVDDLVTFTGQVSDTAAWTDACDIVVSASEAEPYGLVICEAQATGAAVVAVDDGGAREIVDHSVDGLLTRREASALTAAIGRLLADPELCASLGRAATRKAVARHDARRMATDLGAVLREVAA